jgi:hypothetical protein
MNNHFLMKIILLTWGVYDANRRTAHSMLSKTKQKKNGLQINSVGQKLSTVWGNFSPFAGTPGTHRDIAFSQLAG